MGDARTVNEVTTSLCDVTARAFQIVVTVYVWFIQVIDNCSTVASDTHTKYGT